MVNYSISEFTNKETGAKFYYAIPQVKETISTKVIAKRISRQCTVTFADVLAVLQALGENIHDELVAGNQVYLEGIGKIRLSLRQVSSNDIKEFTQNNITGATARLIAGDELKDLFTDTEFALVASRKEQALTKSALREGKTISVVSKN